MKLDRFGAAFAAIILAIGFSFTWLVPADAACRQVLAPNRWQYITVCDGNRGSSNYGGAIAAGVTAGAIALELLPGIIGSVGDVTSGVGEITSGVMNNVGSAAGNVTAPIGDTGAVSINPFNIFSQEPDVPCSANDRKRGCRNIKGNAAAFGTNNNDEQYVVDPGGCSANRAVFGGCQKMQPRQTCNETGCFTEYVAVPPAKKKNNKKEKDAPSPFGFLGGNN